MDRDDRKESSAAVDEVRGPARGNYAETDQLERVMEGPAMAKDGTG
jgi:hypothetical protein